jgi:molybdenum cofactor guanylyltransferase
MPPLGQISGVIFCGGRGQRYGGRDKGLLRLRGYPLASHAAARLGSQVNDLYLSINRNQSRYRALGLPTVMDRNTGFEGPLSGLLSAMACIDTPYIVTLPCDSPNIPADYVARLWRRLRTSGADICVVRDSHGLFPLHALMKTRLRAGLAGYLVAGGAAVHRWVRQQRWSCLEMQVMNLNSLNELRACANRARGRAFVPRYGV